MKFLELGNSVQYRNDVYRDIESRTERLPERTNNRVHFTVEEHGKGVHVFHEPGENRVWKHNTEGKRQYLHATAAGKAILSELPGARVDEILDRHGLPELTDRTITDREELFEELEAIRERGYARNDQETIEGIRAVGAPVTAPWGGVIGALSVGGPETSLRGEYWEEELPNIVAGSVNELELDLALA
ncbi:MAG: IclR family transcriptional regulator [Halobacteriales archaeon]